MLFSFQSILKLLQLASTVTAGLSEVHPDAVAECQSATREFYATLRLIYASMMAQIRAHAGELHHMGAVPPVAGAGPQHSAAAAAAQVASIAAAAHEYRRNVYLDTQSMQVALESLDIHKDRIAQLQDELSQLQAQTQQP